MESYQEGLKAFEKGDLLKAETQFLKVLNTDFNSLTEGQTSSNQRLEKIVEIQEGCILKLGEIYSNEKNDTKLRDLLESSRKLISKSFAKSKAAKIIKTLLDLIETISTDLDSTIEIINECIEWCIENKRSFLRQYLEIRLSSIHYQKNHYQNSLEIINKLLKEFKKLDDKSSLVEVQLLESKNYFQLKNYAKSKAALTSARTSANSIYCPSNIQSELDLMSGILNAQDSDFETAYSYFYESFENNQLQKNNNNNNNSIDDNSSLKSIKILKYMILCKIMLGNIDEVNLILKQKNVQSFINTIEIESMKSVSNAYQNRSLKDLENSLKKYNNELALDPIIRSHLSDLYDNLFQQNLLKLIEPYSIIEIQHICSMIGLPKNVIENKLSNMILDGIIHGVIDQGNGWLIIYNESKSDKTYDLSLEVIKYMSNAVDSLYEKASILN